MKKERMYFTENDDLIDIRYDNVFKAVFTKNTPESQYALADLVSAQGRSGTGVVKERGKV